MKTLIFDFDGTIADSFEVILEIFEEIYPKPQKLTRREIQILRGKPVKEIFAYLKIRRWQIPKLLFRGKQAMASKMNKIQPFDLKASLKSLKKSGYQMHILSTNTPSNIEVFLKNHALDGYFKSIQGNIGIRGKAPALKKLLRKQGLAAADCIYIGDEVRDIDAAKKVGMTSLSVTWGFNTPQSLKRAEPDIIVHKPRELAKAIKAYEPV